MCMWEVSSSSIMPAAPPPPTVLHQYHGRKRAGKRKRVERAGEGSWSCLLRQAACLPHRDREMDEACGPGGGMCKASS